MLLPGRPVPVGAVAALDSGAFVPPAALGSHGTSPLLPPGKQRCRRELCTCGLATLEGFSSSFQIADAVKNI